MTLDQLAAPLAAASILAVTCALDDGRASEAHVSTALASATPEVQRCLDKLERRLQFRGRSHGWAQIEKELLELQQTDPACALLLSAASF